MSENLGPNPNLKRGHIRGPAKVTKILKQAILDAAEKAGGRGGTTAYLVRQATENPTAFMSLLGKILPTQIDHSSKDGTMTPAGESAIDRIMQRIDAIAERGGEAGKPDAE